MNDEYILDATVELVRVGPDRFRVRGGVSGGEVGASKDEIRLLRRFEGFSTPDDALEDLSSDRDAAIRFLEACIDEGILLPGLPSGVARLPERRRSSPTLFDVPHHRPDDPATFTFLGVPVDGGMTGARHGPGVLRRASQRCRYVVDPETLEPRGFEDLAAGRILLKGAALADAGDINLAAGEDPHDAWDRITSVVRELLEAGSTPLILGGDQSITYSVLRAFHQDRLAVVHLDASSDLEPVGLSGLTHSSVFSVVLERLELVECVHQVGLRGLQSPRSVPSDERLRRYGIDRLRALGPTCLADAVPADLPCYVSIDAGVLDPSVAPSVSRPVPGGLLPHELRAILKSVAESRPIVGAEIVEVGAPAGPADGTALLALEALLTLADGARRVRAG